MHARVSEILPQFDPLPACRLQSGMLWDPKTERNRGYSGKSAAEVEKASAQTTREELEALVMEMLERLNN